MPSTLVAQLRDASDPDGEQSHIVDDVVAAQAIGDTTIVTPGMLRTFFGPPNKETDPAEDFLVYYAAYLPAEEDEGAVASSRIAEGGSGTLELRQELSQGA